MIELFVGLLAVGFLSIIICISILFLTGSIEIDISINRRDITVYEGEEDDEEYEL